MTGATLHIGEFLARYHLPDSERDEADRFDAVLADSVRSEAP